MLARFPGAWGPAQQLKCWSKGNPTSHGTVQLRLRKPSNAPQGQRIGGYGSVLRPGPMGLRRNKKLKKACKKLSSESGGIQANPGPRGLWARSPGAWGPGPQGLGPGPPGAHKNHTQITILLVGAWRRRGCRLKRLLRRWGPGGKRSRDTPPTPPPPTRFGALRLQGRRTLTYPEAPAALNP